MITLNCFTNGFAGQPSSVSGKTPVLCQWVYFQNPFDDITIFEDGHIWQTDARQIATRKRIGWLHEAKALRPENYEAAWVLRERFDFILTHDESLVARDPQKFKFCIRGGVTVPRDDWRLWPKTYDVAMLLSDKLTTYGHRLRNEIAKKTTGIDIYRNVPKSVLRNYRFAVVVEAAREGHLFTEHLLDTIAYGCIPLYWGTKHIAQYLDLRGIVEFDSIADLQVLVNDADAVYNIADGYRAVNLQRIADYEVTEDWFVKTYFGTYAESNA